MKTNKYKSLGFLLITGLALAGCATDEPQVSSNADLSTPPVTNDNEPMSFVPELEVRFGREGAPFTMNLYDNDTARAIASYVGTSDWNLPIYHYDDYENYEVMQYYDIPSRYEIPSNPEMITSQKAGEVFYSEPNRIVLFYHDATIPGEYTRLGTFDASEEFISAVENNPVQEGWGNKIISIQPVR